MTGERTSGCQDNRIV